jgi:putative transposase
MKYEPFVPDTFFHLYNHAVWNENLFRNENNYQYFLRKFGAYSEPICQTFAYCLMPNHFHFLIRVKSPQEIVDFYIEKQKIKDPNFVPVINPETFDYHDFVMQQFQNMCNGYAQAYNKMFQRKGALFMDYIKRKSVNDESYFTNLVHYIHYNPVHHNFIKDLKDWKYSSYQSFLSDKPTRLQRNEVLSWFGNVSNFISFHQNASIEILDFE